MEESPKPVRGQKQYQGTPDSNIQPHLMVSFQDLMWASSNTPMLRTMVTTRLDLLELIIPTHRWGLIMIMVDS